MKKELKSRISKIHAVKTNKAKEYHLSEASYQEQERLKLVVDDLENDSDFTRIIQEINTWAGINPIATEREIKELM